MPGPIQHSHTLMNWRHILAGSALAVSILVIGGGIWLTDPDRRDRIRLLRGNADATILIQLAPAERPESDRLDCGTDANTFAMLFRSQKITQRTIESFSADELVRVLGSSFLQTGRTPFLGISIEPVHAAGEHIRIVSEHAEPAVARLIAERLVKEFIRYVYDVTRTDTERTLDEFEVRKRKLIEELKHAEGALVAMNREHNPAAYENAEQEVKIRRALLCNLEERIADAATRFRRPPQFPYRITAAQVESGPFWDRMTADFTAEAQRLLEP